MSYRGMGRMQLFRADNDYDASRRAMEQTLRVVPMRIWANRFNERLARWASGCHAACFPGRCPGLGELGPFGALSSLPEKLAAHGGGRLLTTPPGRPIVGRIALRVEAVDDAPAALSRKRRPGSGAGSKNWSGGRTGERHGNPGTTKRQAHDCHSRTAEDFCRRDCHPDRRRLRGPVPAARFRNAAAEGVREPVHGPYAHRSASEPAAMTTTEA